MNVRMMPPQGPMGQPMPMGGAPAPMGGPMGPPPMPMGGPGTFPVSPMQPTVGQQNKKGLGSTFGGNAQGRGQFKNFMSAKKQTSALVPQIQPSMQPMGSAPPMAQPMAAPQPMLPGPAPQMMGALRPMGNAQVSMPVQAGRPMRGSQGGLGSAPVQLNRGGEVEIPRRTDIYGQDHMLAYIRPDEAEILKGLGAMGTPGPGGIPQYGFWADTWAEITSGGAAETETYNSGSSSSSSGGGGGSDYSFMDANEEEDFNLGTGGYTAYNPYENNNDNDNTSTTVTTTVPTYTDTSSLTGISDASGFDYTGGDTDTDSGTVTVVTGSSGYPSLDATASSYTDGPGFDIGAPPDTGGYYDTGTDYSFLDSDEEEDFNLGTGATYDDTYEGGTVVVGGADDSSSAVSQPVEPTVYYDMFGGEHATQEAANAADKAYTDAQETAVNLVTGGSDGIPGYYVGDTEYQGPDIDLGPSQQQSEASNNTAKLMNDYSTISDDYSTFQGNDLSTGDGNTIGYATGGSKVGYSAIVNPVTGGIDIITPGSGSVEASFAADELTDALNYLTDGDVDLSNLDAPADLLAGSVTGTETGDVGLESGVDAIDDIIERLDTEGLDSFGYDGTDAERLEAMNTASFSGDLTDIPDDALDFVEVEKTDAEKVQDLVNMGVDRSLAEAQIASGGEIGEPAGIDAYDFGRTDALTSSQFDLTDGQESVGDGLTDYEREAFGTDAETFYGDLGDTEADSEDTAGSEDVAGSFENLLNTQPVDQSQMNVISDTIKELEGFGSDTYFDVNAERAGYGSDTKTDPVTGEVTQIEPGMTVTKEEAEADLNRRLTTEFIPSVVDAVGADTFYAMDPTTQAALTSIAYNYGANWAEKLPSLAEAAKTGNTDLIADAIEDRSVDNDGINATRRLREAEMVRSGVPLGGDTDIYADDDVALSGTATGKGTGVGGADTEIVTEVTGDTGQTATQAYLSAMTKLDNPETMTMMEQQALYGARGQTPNAAETAYLNALLRDAKHKEDGPAGADGEPIYKAGDYVVQQTGAEQFGDLIVKGIDFFLNPLTILGDKYSLENMNEAYVQEQLDAYKNGGTFVYDGAGTVVGIADANYDADGDGENDSVVLIGDDGEYTVSSGRVGIEDVENSNQYSDTDEDIDDIDIVDSNTTFTNTEGGVLTSDPDRRKEQEETEDEPFVDPCPEGFVLDPVLGECVPIEGGVDTDSTAGTPSLGDVIRPDTGSGTPTPTPTPTAGEPMIIRGPKQFNEGGEVEMYDMTVGPNESIGNDMVMLTFPDGTKRQTQKALYEAAESLGALDNMTSGDDFSAWHLNAWASKSRGDPDYIAAMDKFNTDQIAYNNALIGSNPQIGQNRMAFVQENAPDNQAAIDANQALLDQIYGAAGAGIAGAGVNNMGADNIKDASGMPDTRGPNVPGNRPPATNVAENTVADPFNNDYMSEYPIYNYSEGMGDDDAEIIDEFDYDKMIEELNLPVGSMILRTPKQFNVGGAVTPNIDRFMQSLGV